MNPLQIPLGHPSTWYPYSHAPFHSYVGMVRLLKGLQAENDDAMILLDGLEGSGKSTVGFRLVNHLNPSWTAEDGLIIDYEDWENVYNLESGRVFLLDEGGDLLFSRDSQRGENKLMVRMFQMARIFNHVIVVVCPNIHWVDLYVRDHRALIYGHVHKKFHATGVHRGLVTWNWPRRYFDNEKMEWHATWNRVVDSRFQRINPNLPKWVAYERLKRMKVQKRQLDLTERLKR